MTRLIIFSLIWILFASCSGKEKKEVYNPKAIELNNKAIGLMKRFRNDSALVVFDQAIDMDKTYYLPHSNKAVIFVSKKEYDKALMESEKVIQLKPDLAEGWTYAGMLNEKQGNIETAMKYYKKSIELFDERISNPEKKDRIMANKLSRAFSFILLGQEEKGKEEMRKLKAEKPDELIIDEFLKVNKQDYMNQMFNNE